MNVKFSHPKYSDMIFEVDVDPSLTGSKALKGLQTDFADGKGPFLPAPMPGRPYSLIVQRTKKEIGPDTRFADVDVIEGDFIEVFEQVYGA